MKFSSQWKLMGGVFAASAVVLGALGAAWYFSHEELVCEGLDPKSGRLQRLTVSRKYAKEATVRLYSGPAEGPANALEAEDRHALVQGAGQETTITMQGEKGGNIHVVKECGAKPRCELHRYELPPPSVLKKEQENTMRAERKAFEYRAATGRQAAEFARARQEALQAEAKLKDLKAQAGVLPKKLAEAEAEFKRLHDLATEQANKLFAMSAVTHDVNKHANEVRSLSSLNRIDLESHALNVVNAEKWCPR